MNKRDYLINALKHKAYGKKGWVFSCFTKAIVTDKGAYYPYRLYKDDKGYYTHTDEHSPKEYITDADTDTDILFPAGFKVTVTHEDVINVKKGNTIKTTARRLLANAILLTHNYGDKIEFTGEDITFKSIEDILYHRLVDNGSKEDGIEVREMLKFHTSSVYLDEFSMAFTSAATDKNTSPPPGLQAYKKKLLKEYGDKINDPIVQTEFEGKLVAYASKYLKGDPSQGKLLSGKMSDSYKKMFLSYGSAKTFGGEFTDFRPEGLEEGMPTDSRAHADKMNDLRSGSFMRAKGTQEGGIVPKILAAAINNYIVTDNDCGTKQTRTVTIIGDPIKYAGAYTLKGGKPVLLDIASLKEYDTVEIRDPMFCKNKSDTYCAICAGDKLSKSGKSIGLIATEVGMATLSQKLKSFHATNLKTKEVDLLALIS